MRATRVVVCETDVMDGVSVETCLRACKVTSVSVSLLLRRDVPGGGVTFGAPGVLACRVAPGGDDHLMLRVFWAGFPLVFRPRLRSTSTSGSRARVGGCCARYAYLWICGVWSNPVNEQHTRLLSRTHSRTAQLGTAPCTMSLRIALMCVVGWLVGWLVGCFLCVVVLWYGWTAAACAPIPLRAQDNTITGKHGWFVLESWRQILVHSFRAAHWITNEARGDAPGADDDDEDAHSKQQQQLLLLQKKKK